MNLCTSCGTLFETVNSSRMCRDCHLYLITGPETSPEEGDFATSSQLAGEPIDPQTSWMMAQELRALEEGRSCSFC